MSNFLSDPADARAPQLASNNPFRRAVSPAAPTSPFLDPAPSTNNGRPVSRNPFLDPSNDKAPDVSNSDLLISLDDTPSTSHGGSTSIDDIFNSLSVDSKPMSPLNNPAAMGADGRPRPTGAPPGRGRGAPPPPVRAKNMPPQLSGSHRPSQSQEESVKSRHVSGSRDLGVSGSSADARPRTSRSRPRRNSESSVAPTDGASKSASRDVRKREERDRDRSGSARPRRRNNDIIDQMDASSIFGTVFHHDGPFDALNPHRNRKGSRRPPPMQAFPKDSLNNSLGGSGPLNARPDHSAFMGQGGEEAFMEFSTNRPAPPQASDKYTATTRLGLIDPKQRSSVLHGDQSLGLGTSTFLEGTPATRTAIQRREVEKVREVQDNPLQRKKSLAQRFRSINRGPRDPNSTRAFSSDGGPGSSQSANGRYNEPDPFDEFDAKRSEDILSVRRKDSSGYQSPPSPPRGVPLERRSTTDGNSESVLADELSRKPPTPPESAQPKPSGGLLSRVKSLKGGRRPPPPPPPPVVRDY